MTIFGKTSLANYLNWFLYSGIGLVDVELKLKAIKSFVDKKKLVNQSDILNRIIIGYLEKINIDINFLLTLPEKNGRFYSYFLFTDIL